MTGAKCLMSGSIGPRRYAHRGTRTPTRPVVLFEGGVFPVRRLLIDLLQHRREEGATDNDLLFGWRKGAGLNTVLREANCLYDPTTGKNRVMYSFRHHFATLLISRGLSVGKLAEWLGTSSSMIEKHYNRYLVEREAYLVNGSAPPEPISNCLLYQESGDPDEAPDNDGLDTQSVTKGL
jgi:hypothetical protein